MSSDRRALPGVRTTCQLCGACCLAVSPRFTLYRHLTPIDVPCYGPDPDQVLSGLLEHADLLAQVPA